MNNAAKLGFFIENSPFSFPDASFPLHRGVKGFETLSGARLEIGQ